MNVSVAWRIRSALALLAWLGLPLVLWAAMIAIDSVIPPPPISGG